jgi:hypothetical protein
MKAGLNRGSKQIEKIKDSITNGLFDLFFRENVDENTIF